MENVRLNDKYLIITVSNDKPKMKNLRRYLSNHQFSFKTVECVEDAFNVFLRDIFGPQESDFIEVGVSCPKVEEENVDYEPSSVQILPTSQELLIHWARETFPEGSEELKLLFGAEEGSIDSEEKSSDGSDKKELVNLQPAISGRSDSRMSYESEGMSQSMNQAQPEEAGSIEGANDIPTMEIDKRIFDTSITDKEPHFEDYSSSDDEDTKKKQPKRYITNGFCQICRETINVGKTRKCELRNQANHIIRNHQTSAISDVLLSRRFLLHSSPLLTDKTKK